jgi:hypothetical protein
MTKAIECGYRGVFPESERIQEAIGFIEKHSDRSWREGLDEDDVPSNVHQIN